MNISDEKKRYAALARQAAAEGIVLLKNDENALPLPTQSKVAVFGRAQLNYYKSGTGSGGLVNAAYVTGIWEALSAADGYLCDAEIRKMYTDWVQEHPFDQGNGWAQEPWYQQEMPLEEEVVCDAAQRNDAAVVVIGRTAGEDQDNRDVAGSFRLTEAEEAMIAAVCKYFKRSIVLLNVGNILDMRWVARYDPAAVAYVWQGGQEGGAAVRDVLCGAVCPSGRLSDTIAVCADAYPAAKNFGDARRNFYAEDIYIGYRYFETFEPENVLYPFGFGLSYTQFAKEIQFWDRTSKGVTAAVSVKNTGTCAGKEVVQLYVQAPQGRLGKPARVLCAFAKSHTLNPGESETLRLDIPWKTLASYDDSGASGHKAAWVLEEGTYRFYLGGDVRSAELAFDLPVQACVVEQLEPAAGPYAAFERLRPGSHAEKLWEPVPLMSAPPRCQCEDFASEIPYTGDVGLRLTDVYQKRASLQAFLGQFTLQDLCCIVRGEGMNSPRVTPGTAGAFGGVSSHLQQMGIPAACCSDGPSGIRMDCGTKAFSLPNGTCLACTFNTAISEALFAMLGQELRRNHIDLLLGPGINLHRHPLNGRNFEYFSEDPLLTGKMAAAQLRGLNQWGVAGTIKHLACNNQEQNRHQAEAIVSERALRELYLRGFELAIRESAVCAVMTAYNPVNGYWASSQYDIVTTILRKEWGYDGIVMSDWWAEGSEFQCEGTKENVAAMVRAQNDLYMVAAVPEENSGADNLEQALQNKTLTRSELLRSAANICRFVMQTPAFMHQIYGQSLLDEQLEKYAEDDEQQYRQNAISVIAQAVTLLDTSRLDTASHKTTVYCIQHNHTSDMTLEINCRTREGNTPLAQIPLSLFAGKTFLGTITLNGSQTQWQTCKVKIPAKIIQNPLYLRFFFGGGGMEIDQIKLLTIDPDTAI